MHSHEFSPRNGNAGLMFSTSIPPPATGRPGQFRREHALYLASLLAFGFVILTRLVDPLRVNYDVAAAISIARLLLHGATPYVDYINLNPPLIHYLHVVPAWIAERLSVNPIITFSWLVLVMSGWTVFAVHRVSRALEDRPTGRLVSAVVILATALLSVKLTVFDAFGQREHIFILLYLPYLLLRWLRLHPHRFVDRRLEIWIGVAAGIGLCLKPHFLLIEASVEAFLGLQLRSLRKLASPELLAVALVGAAYAAHFAFLPEEARAGMREVLGWLDSGGYKAYGDHSLLEIITSDLKTLGLALATFVLVRDPRGRLGSLLQLCAVLTLASLLEAGLQARNFFYHGIPNWTGTYLIVLLVIFGYGAEVRIRGPQPNGSSIGRLLSQATSLVVYGLLFLSFLGWSNIIGPADLAILTPPGPDAITRAIAENSPPGSSVLIISTGTGLFRSATQANREVASRFFPDFPIAFSLVEVQDGDSLYHNRQAVRALLESHLSGIEDRIREKRPELIVIDGAPTCSGCPRGLNLALLLREIGFSQRAILPAYTQVGEYDGHQLYRRSLP